MAEFVKEPNLPQPTAYTGASQGVSPARSNERMGDLFKGLGKLVGDTSTFLDERNKSKIEEELYSGIDAIRGAQGVDAAAQDAASTQIIPDTSNTPSGGVATPAAVDTAVSEIARLNAAYKDGKIGDSQYWAKTEALTRQVRARYPGYREEIDKKVSQITGTTPANALRRSLLEDLEKAARAQSGAADKFDTFVKQNLEHISPETRKKILSGERSEEFKASVINEVGDSQLNNQLVKKEKDQLDLEAKRGTVTAERAEAVAISEANQYVMRSINAGVSGAGGGELMKRITTLGVDAAAGKPLKPEEITAVRGQFALLKNQLKTGVLDILQKPLNGNTTNSYSTLIRDKGKLDGITTQALARLESMEQLLINGEFGAFAANANAIKASENAKTREILESNEFFRTFNSAKDIVGREAIGVWLNSPQGMTGLSEISKVLNDLSLSKNLTGQKKLDESLQTIIDAAPKNAQGKPILDPKGVREYLNTTQRLLSSDKLTGDGFRNLVQSTFSDEGSSVVGKFQESQRAKVFAQLTSPEVTARMVKEKASDPKSWETYKAWSLRNFYSVNKQGIDTLNAEPLKDIGVNLAVDDNGRLRLIDTNPSGYRKDQMPGDAMIRGPRIAQVQGQIDRFNQGLDSLDPILKADGVKVKDGLGAVYKQMGLAVEDKESGNADSPKSKSSSLGNMIQLTSFTQDDNTVTGLRDRDLLSLEGEATYLDLDGPAAKEVAQASGAYKPILNIIGRAEAPRGYNQIFGRGREAPLTEMTISEVYDLQRRMLRSGSESSAVGRYQFLRDTLKETVAVLGLDPDTVKMTPEIQDQLATALVGKHLKAYKAGRIDKDTLADRLADKWAGLPLANGQSRYKGVGNNNATVSRQAVLDAIDELAFQ